MTRDTLIEVLENIALLLELKGENPFKIRAYRNGAEIVQTYSGDIVQLARDNELKGIKGIGDALQQKLHELASSGKLGYYEDLRSEFPDTLFDLFKLQGLGPKKVKALYDALGVDSLGSLKAAAEAGKVAELPGFAKKSEDKILEAIAFREHNAEYFRLGDVAAPAEMIVEALRAHPDTSRAEVAGSMRRGKEIVHDLDFLVATKKPQAVMDDFVAQPWVDKVIAHGETKSSVYLDNGLQCDLRAVSIDEYPFALMYFTGSKEHNVAIRGRAQKRGYTLNEYRLAPSEPAKGKKNKAPKPPVIHDEKELYSFLGLDYVEPELRENTGEIECAAGEDGDLPKLIERENLRGTFHNHTIASDGKNTLAEMAAAAIDLGLQYLGIADHSKASFQANGLDETRLRAQIEEIKKLNAGYQNGGTDFCIFAGTEVDILRDGSLDFDDQLLAELDYSVASIHNAFTLSEKDMTRRILKAVENPHVTMLGHLTGRLLLERDPYAVNVPKIIDACAANGTIIELNCNPWRLDMDWRWWKMAKDKGVRCAINPDAHSTEGLQYLHFGIVIARKGWLTRDDVVNCLPLEEMRKLLAQGKG